MVYFRIPEGTSAELTDLLNGLLKRDADERMTFETFFGHKFLESKEPINSFETNTSPVPVTLGSFSPPGSKIKPKLATSSSPSASILPTFFAN